MYKYLTKSIHIVASLLLFINIPLFAGETSNQTSVRTAVELNAPPMIRAGGIYLNYFNPYYNDGGVVFSRLEKNRLGELAWSTGSKPLDFKNIPPFMPVAVDFDGHAYAVTEDSVNSYGIRLINPEAVNTKFLFKLPEAMSKIAIRPNGNIVTVNASDNPPFKVYEFARDGTVISIKTGAVKYHSIAFSSSGQLYGLYIHGDGGMYLYEIKDDWSGQKRLTQTPFYGGILRPSNLCFTEKGSALVGGSVWYQLDITNGLASKITDIPTPTYTGIPQIVCR